MLIWSLLPTTRPACAAAVDGLDGIEEQVAEIGLQDIGGGSELHSVPGGGFAVRRTVGSGVTSKIVIEGAVLLDDEDDVFDGNLEVRTLIAPLVHRPGRREAGARLDPEHLSRAAVDALVGNRSQCS